MRAPRLDDNRRRKGVSALVAAVLLIAVVLVLVVGISSWLGTFTKERQAAITNTSTGFVNCAASGLSIDSVYLDFSSNVSRVIVRNTGQNAEKITSAQLLNTAGQAAALNTTLPLNLSIGDMGSMIFNISGAMTSCQNFSQARVGSACTSDFYQNRPANC